MLTEKLKNGTLQHHQQLEKQLVQRMKAIYALPGYIDLLQLFYTYFGGLEEQIDLYITPQQLPDYNERRKSEALAQDITGLGGTVQIKAGKDSLPVISSSLQAFGALYVIEGSTLGGQIISKMMEKQLSLPDSKGLSFFNSYGDRTNDMWTAFRAALNAQAHNAAEEQEIIDAANQTFLKFEQWIRRYNEV